MIDIGTEIPVPPETFRVIDRLSAGGFGQTFLAERHPSGSKVVIKIPQPFVLTHPIWSQKFAREARILANIRHPNVVKILAFWEWETGEKALVQELVDGAQDLKQAIEASPSLAPSLLLQALYALRAFHQSASPSIVHRDISPRNLLVDKNGILKVIDFGLAKEDPRATMILTMTDEAFGTPGCMAPEQTISAREVDHRADLYALGRSFASAIQRRNPQHVDCGRLQEPWREICDKMTQHDESDRYQTADEALQHVQELFAQHSIAIDQFDHHVHENKHRDTNAPGWWKLSEQYFSSRTLEAPELILASLLRSEVFSAGGIVANELFDKFESSPAVMGFDSTIKMFDLADNLGALYRKLFLLLDPARREACLRRVARVAVSHHRYYLMDDVRWIYLAEVDISRRGKMMEIIDAADPGQIIHGKGALPRTP
jgi:serine/threonine protein kinase